jgi:hypothetical protein
MPRVEAAYIGDLPVSAVRLAFLTWADVREIHVFNIHDHNLTEFNLYSARLENK